MVFSRRYFARLCALIAVVVMVVPGIAQTASESPSSIDAANLELRNAKVEPVEHLGRKAMRLTAADPRGEAPLAVLRGVDFQDGTIEADIAVKITVPPGVRMPGFTGLAFRVKQDGSGYEIFYVRPKNAQSEDQAMRNHALQYCHEPDYDWYKLRREWPFLYETYAEIAPERWIHMKIDVAGRAARVYLNGSSEPSLVVDGLKGANLHGAVALWGYAGEESYFANVRVTPSAPVPVKNGSDAAGVWAVQFASDMGRFEGTMKLTREGEKVTGTWSGGLGENKPITGTWRDGHIELSFTGDWPKDGRLGTPGPAQAFLEGWIDEASAKGRMRVDGRAEGPWQAQRQTQQSEKAP